MEKLKAIWVWFGGKKTVIGAVLLSVAGFITQFGVEGSWVAPTIDILTKVGLAFSTIGVAHKAAVK